MFNAAIRRAWQSTWSRNVGNKLRAVKDTVVPWRTSNRRCRREEVLLTRLRIGHTRTTHEFLLKGEEPPICETCKESRTVQHVLGECRKYWVQRRRVFDPGGNGPLTLDLNSMLDDDEVKVRKLMRYLELRHLGLTI